MAGVQPEGAERIGAYKAFLAEHPDNKHKEAVSAGISGMEDEYYTYIEQRICENEKTGHWQQCLKLCEKCIKADPKSEKTQIIEKYQAEYWDKIVAEKTFSDLANRAEGFGND